MYPIQSGNPAWATVQYPYVCTMKQEWILIPPEWDTSLLSVTTSTLSGSKVPLTDWLHPEREAFSENQTLALGIQNILNLASVLPPYF